MTNLVNLANLIREVQEDLRRLGPPPREHRMHPDDWNELKMAFAAAVFEPAPWCSVPMQLDGLPIILDESAPRLPRRGAL